MCGNQYLLALLSYVILASSSIPTKKKVWGAANEGPYLAFSMIDITELKERRFSSRVAS